MSALIGPNGAGKTTLFNIITGFHKADAGAVYIDGIAVNGLKPYQISNIGRGVSRTFQELKLFEEMSVLDNVLVAIKYNLGHDIFSAFFRRFAFKREEKVHRKKAMELLEYVRLAEKAEQKASELSYGQRKLLEITRTIATEGKLLLLDEPVAGVHPKMIGQVIGLIKSIRDDFNRTIFFIEHNMDVVMSISENIVVLNHGEKIAEGPPQEIQKNSKVIEAYLLGGASHAA
ncbi:TPA: ABC transporter ATP-binding protein [Candidatus Poribacteria bacterium]|nr:ABC transporter ATP-binding protein [Candidatus Poribacteria bacterium]